MTMNANKTISPKLNEILKGMWDSLTDEQKEKAKACKTLDELTALAGKEGVELPDEVLDQVGGGCGDGTPDYVICPKCHENVVVSFTGGGLISMTLEWYKRTKCLHCGYEGNDKKSGWIIP
jgi:hypothetical protein